MNQRKNHKRRFICFLSALALLVSMLVMPVMADGTRVVTLGYDLSAEQEAFIINYFGVDLSTARVIYVNNQQEREYVGSWIPIEQIGNITISSAYVQPTNSGGIQVKTANLTYVTGNMIASVLSTAGVKNCNIVAAAPFPVSGTGALTGVMIAYQEATGEQLDSSKRDLAVQEFTVTQQASESIGEQEALQLVNAVKMEVIQSEVPADDTEQIQQIVDQVVADMDQSLTIGSGAQVDSINMDQSVTVDNSTNIDNSTTINNSLTEEDRQLIVDLASAIAQQQYQYDDVKETLQRVEENLSDQTNINISIDNSNTNSNDTEINNDNSAEASADNSDENSILNNTQDDMIAATNLTATDKENIEAIQEAVQQEQAEAAQAAVVGSPYVMEEIISSFPENGTPDTAVDAPEAYSQTPDTAEVLPENVTEDVSADTMPEYVPETVETADIQTADIDTTDIFADQTEELPESEPVAGGWVMAAAPTQMNAPEEIVSVWNSVPHYDDNLGLDLTAIAYLGQQIVEGVNYRFLCADDQEEAGLHVVTVYQDPDGYAIITNLADFDLDELENSQNAQFLDEILAGSWTFGDAVEAGPVPENAMAAWNAMAMSQSDGSNSSLVTLLGVKQGAGTEYAILCYEMPEGSESGYFAVAFIHTGEDGGYQYSNLVPLDLADYNE